MQIVINVPEALYEAYKDRPPMLGDAGMDMIAQSIANGTPLPKGHGRLFILDESKAIKYFTNFSFSVQKWISEVDISKATLAVIKADNAESEE